MPPPLAQHRPPSLHLLGILLLAQVCPGHNGLLCAPDLVTGGSSCSDQLALCEEAVQPSPGTTGRRGGARDLESRPREPQLLESTLVARGRGPWQEAACGWD